MKSLLVLSVVCMLCGTAQAAVIFDNGSPQLEFGTGMSEFLVADDFVVSATANIDTIRFWSQETQGGYSGSTYWAIHSANGGLPGNLLQGGSAVNVSGTATGNSNFGYDEKVYDIAVNFQLVAGTYFLALHNGALGNTTGDMLWSPTGIIQNGPQGPNTFAAVYTTLPLAQSPVWNAVGNEQAFQILGTFGVNNEVPEPATVLLVAAGLLGGAMWRRRRQ